MHQLQVQKGATRGRCRQTFPAAAEVLSAVFQKETGSTCFIEEVARRKRRSFSRDISPHEVMQQQNCL